MEHLFFSCGFSQNFWSKLNIDWQCNLNLMDMLVEAKGRSNLAFFDIAMMVGCWSIWNHRNKIIFEGDPVNLDVCFDFFLVSVHLIRHRIRPSLKEGLLTWLDLL